MRFIIIIISTTIYDGTISSIVFNPGSYTGLTSMTITIADPPTKVTLDTATATPSLSTSITNTFTISTAGTGYNYVPTISFSGGGGSGELTTAVLTTGTLTAITLVSRGSGFSSAPTFAISPLVTETTTGVVNVLTDTSLSVTPTNPTTNGCYSSAPAVSFTGTGTSGVTGTAVLRSGRVTSVTIAGTVPSGLLISTSAGNVTVGGGGTGYNVIPNVSFTSGGGSGETETAVLTVGVVSGITVSNAIGTGLNYTSAPTVVIDPPTTGAIQVTGTVVFASVTSITVTVSNTVTNGYYTSAPAVSFNYINGVTGTGAIGTAVLTSGRVTSVTMSGTMSGYVAGTLPTVTIDTPTTATCTIGGDITVSFAVPTSTTAVATCTLTGASISSVSLTNAGWYYTNAPFVSITGGTGSGAFITSTIKDGKVISFNIVSGGTGYTSSPTLTLTDAPAGVTATTTLTFSGSKISGYTMTGGSGYKIAPTITIGTTTGTSVIPATFQTVLGGITYVKKFS